MLSLTEHTHNVSDLAWSASHMRKARALLELLNSPVHTSVKHFLFTFSVHTVWQVCRLLSPALWNRKDDAASREER